MSARLTLVAASVALAGVLLLLRLEQEAPHRVATAPEALGSAPTPSFAVPALRGRVNDYADLLTPTQETELETLYRSLEQEVGSQVALLTIESLHGIRIEDYSLKVANTWALGRRDVDDGVLITMAVEDRMVRIEVGYGLESVISNETASQIIQQNMIPEFKKGEFFKGLEQGSQEIVQRIRANPKLVGKRTMRDPK